MGDYQETLTLWEARQSSVADDRVWMISSWLAKSRGDAETQALRPSVQVLLAPESAAVRLLIPPVEARRRLTPLLDRVAEAHGYTAIYVLDRQLRLIARSTTTEELDQQSLNICRTVVRDGGFRIDILGRSPEKSRLLYSKAIFAEEPLPHPIATDLRPVGVIALVADPNRSLFPLLKREIVPTRTGETILVREEGNQAVFFSPLRFRTAGSAFLRRPLNTAPSAALAAAQGREVFGEFTDYRGARVFAATRRVPQTGWGLVRKIDREEALAAYRHTARLEWLATGFFLVAFAGLLTAHRRHVLAQAACKERERFRSLVESAPDAMVLVDQQGCIVLVNTQTERLFGYTREELSGRMADVLVPERHRDTYRRECAQLFADPSAQQMINSIVMSGCRKDGSHFPVEATLSLITTAEGTVVSTAMRDTTERQRAEEKIRGLNENLETRVRERTAELEQTAQELSAEIAERQRAQDRINKVNADLVAANRELEAFTYSVSHDLRGPLRHVDGFSRLLLDEHGEELSAEAQRYLGRIRDGIHRMGRMVDDLLNLSRVGRRALNVQLAGLDSLVEEVVKDLGPELEHRQIEWRIEHLPFVECDRDLVKQVLANLVANAVKFTRSREKAVVQIGALDQNGSPVFFVRDNGVGFSMKYCDKLFGVFQRLHRQEDFEGTGVGLATVQRIIHKHGGQVWAEAELNKGATFYFTLAGKKKLRAEDPAAEGAAA